MNQSEEQAPCGYCCPNCGRDYQSGQRANEALKTMISPDTADVVKRYREEMMDILSKKERELSERLSVAMPSSAAPGIDLARVQAALKYAEAAARHNTHTELAADFADLIRRIDASPKGATLNEQFGSAEGLDSPKGGSEAHSAPDAIDMDNGFRSYPWTYRNQPGNVGASVLGGCARRAKPGGDSIDHGLSLLRELHIQGLGVVRVPKLDVGTPASDAEVQP